MYKHWEDDIENTSHLLGALPSTLSPVIFFSPVIERASGLSSGRTKGRFEAVQLIPVLYLNMKCTQEPIYSKRKCGTGMFIEMYFCVSVCPSTGMNENMSMIYILFPLHLWVCLPVHCCALLSPVRVPLLLRAMCQVQLKTRCKWLNYRQLVVYLESCVMPKLITW